MKQINATNSKRVFVKPQVNVQKIETAALMQYSTNSIEIKSTGITSENVNGFTAAGKRGGSFHSADILLDI